MTVPSNLKFCPHDGTSLQSTLPPVATAPTDTAVPAADPLSGTVIDGRYRIGQPLGAGGVGSVYEGEHVEMGKRVAIKTLHGALMRTDEFLRRFEREARALSKLSHPGCVSVIDFGRVQKLEPERDLEKYRDMPYLVMERVDGVNLEDRLKQGALPVGEALHVAKGVLAALRHAHALGIVHRDIKPSNIMLTDAGEPEPLVKLLDFGLAKILGPSESGDSEGRPLTQAGLVFGTPIYMSPEQAQAAAASERAYLYSVGVVLFEMVCGRPPFQHEMYLEIVRSHAGEPPPRPRQLGAQISAVLESVILRALEKEPSARYQTAEDMLAAIASCPESESLRRSRTMPVAAPPATKLPRWLPFAIGGAILATTLLAGALWLRGPSTTAIAVPVPAPPLPVAQPTSSQRRLMMATEYQRRLWCSDAIEELDRAVREDATMRDNAEVHRIAIACLTPKTQNKAVRFLADKVGLAAKPALDRAAAEDANADVRRGAQRALDRILPPPPLPTTASPTPPAPPGATAPPPGATGPSPVPPTQ